MRLRTRLLVLSVSTVAVIVTALFALHLSSLTGIWLESAVERSLEAGKLIASLIVHITDSSDNTAAATPAETRSNWTRIVADDKELADRLVEQGAVPKGVIVEINIIGENGTVILSSIPSRQGRPAPVRQSLASLQDAGFLDQLSAIAKPSSDYETRIPLGIMSGPDRQKPVFEIQLLVSSSLLKDKILPDLTQSAIISLFALIAAVVLAGVSAHLALLPVRRIGQAIDTLSTGRPLGLSQPEDDDADREVAAVQYKLSLLGEQMQKGAQRDADQRMRSAIGTLARGVAHEIKNPLNAISLRLESLRIRISDEIPEAEGEIDLVSDEVHRLDRVVRTFLDLNRPMELDIQEFDPGELAAAALEVMRPVAMQDHVELRLVTPDTPTLVQADRGLIEQGLVNIVNNAIQALGSSNNTGCLVTTTLSFRQNNCEIAVADNGPGMPVSVQERIFEPYFTTKAAGSGIGLAFTKRAMEIHGGGISVTSAPGQGTTMTLSFPVSRRRV